MKNKSLALLGFTLTAATLALLVLQYMQRKFIQPKLWEEIYLFLDLVGRDTLELLLLT